MRGARRVRPVVVSASGSACDCSVSERVSCVDCDEDSTGDVTAALAAARGLGREAAGALTRAGDDGVRPRRFVLERSCAAVWLPAVAAAAGEDCACSSSERALGMLRLARGGRQLEVVSMAAIAEGKQENGAQRPVAKDPVANDPVATGRDRSQVLLKHQNIRMTRSVSTLALFWRRLV